MVPPPVEVWSILSTMQKIIIVVNIYETLMSLETLIDFRPVRISIHNPHYDISQAYMCIFTKLHQIIISL